MNVMEGQTFRVSDQDLPALRRRLGGLLERRPGGWTVTRVVGYLGLPSGEVLRITSPKATGASVLAWMAYVDPTLRAMRWEGSLPGTSSPTDDPGALVARLFLTTLAHAAARSGLVRRYHRIRVRSAAVRGGIDFARLVRQGGELSRLPCIVWERLPETPLNRHLSAVLARIHRDPVLRSACQRELPAARALLAGVRAQISPTILAGTTPLPRTESAYESPCAFGRLLLRQTGLFEGDSQTGAAFLVNLEALFERTVAAAFRESGNEVYTKVPVPYRRLAPPGDPEASGTGAMEMDLFCPTLPGGPVVVDAKYKTTVTSANLQQVVTYCLVSGARRAVLVYPGGHLRDLRSYSFTGADCAGPLRVDLVELETEAGSVSGWRAAARRLVCRVTGH